MSSQKTLTRKQFLRQMGTLGAAAAVLPGTLQATNWWGHDKKIRVAVIGCGSVSTQYLPQITKSPFIEVVATCDIIPDRARQAAEQYGIKNWYPHIEQLLAGVPFDLMLTLTDMQEHGRLNRLALEAGHHVWSEKPLANSYAEGQALLKLAQAKNKRLWCAPAVVQSPQFAFMAKSIQEGKIGQPAAAHAHYGHLGPTWSAFFYEKGGGSLPDLGVYNIASLTGLLGPAIEVVAMTSIVTPERTVDNKGKIKVEAEDNAMLILHHGKGVLSHVQCGFNYFDPYGHGGKGQDRPTISIWGTHGNMNLVGYDWAPFGVDLANVDNEKGERHLPDPGNYVWQMGANVVAETLATGREPYITVEHSLHVLEIMEAARKSQKTGRRIQLKSKFKWPVV